MTEEYIITDGKFTILIRERKSAKVSLDEGKDRLAELMEKEQSIKHDLLMVDKEIQAAKTQWNTSTEKYLLDEISESTLKNVRAAYDAAKQSENYYLDLMRAVNRAKAEFTENKMKDLVEAYNTAERKIWQHVFDKTKEHLDAIHAMSDVARCWALCPEAAGIGDYESLLKLIFPQPTAEQTRAMRAEIEERFGHDENDN